MSKAMAHHAEAVLEAVRSPRGAGVSPIVASWCRSVLSHGLDPERRDQRERVDGETLASLRAQHEVMLDVAMPVLDSLFRAVGVSGSSVILTDASGVVLERRASAADAEAFERAGLVEGARWSEAEEGTNGIGTCLVEDRPIIIHRDQHFASRNVAISCMDAPVHDAHGCLVAALDASTYREDQGAAMSEMIGALVRDAARKIERDLFCRHYRDSRIVFLSDEAAGGTALLAVDRDDLVVGASRGARLQLGLGHEALATPLALDPLLGRTSAPSFDEADRTVLRQALARAQGNASKAARLLGIGRATFYRRMARAGLKL
ncbi:GAF domain-containing protein [Novosphingobium sp. 1949]|uniref:GAF domain-containing protein n=1 Tax=Novosphingobium organovorum TaxID=2930092 RepID=A0ABT0B888_9SPHN|nr:GAF domain-containing protein [Novosphingobium organovorum]MCJ2181281.1 GAF domain-containing protein [Novosphingobium organovorum]